MNLRTQTTRSAFAEVDRWLHRHRARTLPAIILGGTGNGLSFARSLGRRGVPALMLETESFLGTCTRFCKVIRLPPVDRFPDEWLKLLEFVGARLRSAAILFPTSDALTLLVAQHRAALSRRFRFIVAEQATLECVINKRRQYEAARARGILIPPVIFPDSIDDARAVAHELCYPCILKPHDSHTAWTKLAKKVVVVHSANELIHTYQRVTRMNVPLMIQEIIPGPDTALVGYLAFWDNNGRERAWLTKRKLRQFPPQFGDGSLQETVDAPQVAELGRRLVPAFNLRGFVSIEFKYDARDHSWRLMEINPRTVSGNQLAISAGIDFPWLGYRYLCDERARPLEPVPHFRRNIKYVNEEWDIQAFLALRKTGGLTFGGWLRSLARIDAHALGAWDDPRPLLVGLARFARFVASRQTSGTS